MDQILKSEKQLLESIIEREGDCISAAWCLMCPFQKDCISKAINNARLLEKDERVRRAYNKLFDELMEEELDEKEDI